ncbi:hypothetical protein E4U42_000350 [Claviceps africana]|uniref:Uncharacterized protein n=1 Tax=Claviceps africana TaxID=83212 RepID=A0A8K0J2N0_9HYPO|nr:hypothetical protein E4U42_000350 [Claviceps africana]
MRHAIPAVTRRLAVFLDHLVSHSHLILNLQSLCFLKAPVQYEPSPAQIPNPTNPILVPRRNLIESLPPLIMSITNAQDMPGLNACDSNSSQNPDVASSKRASVLSALFGSRRASTASSVGSDTSKKSSKDKSSKDKKSDKDKKLKPLTPIMPSMPGVRPVL